VQASEVQGEVTAASLMRTQMANLMDDVEQGSAPWADGAIRMANNAMIKRGLGASSVAGAAISQAVLEAAMPIAQFDASVYGAMNLQNARMRQETMLSNTAAQNAALQFNATSEGELDKFMATLRDRVVRFNVEQGNEMSRFNSEQTNSVNQFYDKMSNETDKFLSQNKMLIAQSNVEWRRGLNLANTAALNAGLQRDAQNRFNISQQANADLWQRARDVFHWANTVSENQADRANNLAMYTIQRSDFLQDVDNEQRNEFFGLVGSVAADIITDFARKKIA
jgi:hypothetical protein